jgi:NADH:ubiquinone oxidoreductase subunit 4 (subunit M)
MGLLSLAIWLPIVVGTLLLAFGRNSANVVRWVALLGSIASFVVTLPLYTRFQNGTSARKRPGSNASTSTTTWGSTGSPCGWCC